MVEDTTKTKKPTREEEFAKPRTRGALRTITLEKSDIPAPEIPNEQFGPQAFAAVAVLDEEGNPTGEFTIDPDKAMYLHFAKPGGQIPNRPSYTIKAMHRDGRLAQVPFEPQINNSAAGDKEDAIGLHRARRKGLHLFFDFDTMAPLYCPASDCWAMANQKYGYFCSPGHAHRTLPNTYDEAGEIIQGLMSRGVTTSRVWAS